MSKEIKVEDVLHIGSLARLKIDENEVNNFKEHMQKVLSYVDELSSVDTLKIEPMFTLVREMPEKFEQSLLRKDEIKKSLEVEQVLRNAPARKDNQFEVKAVIEENS